MQIRSGGLRVTVHMVRDRWLFSIIQHQSARSVPTPFGVVLFRPGGGLMVRLIERAPSNMEPGGARWLMAARALSSRLRTANPKTRDDILAFIRLEGNEMGLAEPQPVPVIMSAEQILEFLFHRYVRSENRLEDFLRLMGRGTCRRDDRVFSVPQERRARLPLLRGSSSLRREGHRSRLSYQRDAGAFYAAAGDRVATQPWNPTQPDQAFAARVDREPVGTASELNTPMDVAQPLELEGEIARALALAGLSFAIQRTRVDGLDLRIFKLPFQPENEGPPIEVSAYVSGPFLMAGCSIVMDPPVDFERLSDEVTNSIPLVRILKAPPPLPAGKVVYWVEATAVLHSPPWRGDAANLAVAPVSIVSTAVKLLQRSFPGHVVLAPEMVPFVHVAMDPVASTPPPAAKAS